MAEASTENNGFTGKRALLVDDEPSVLKYLERTLKEVGFVCDAVSTGEEALAAAAAARYDLAVIDYRLSDIDGVDVAARLRSAPPPCPALIIISGVGTDETIIEAFTKGRVDSFMIKPFTGMEMIQAATVALREAARRDEEVDRRRQLQEEVKRATAALSEKNRQLEEKERELTRLNDELRIDRSRLEEANERLKILSITDELTGLYNHRLFVTRLDEEADRVNRYGGGLGVVMADLDDFKRVNDTWGHQVGDEVLRRTGAAIKRASRRIDIAARYGGEEFAVILPLTDRDGAVAFAERLRVAVERETVVVDGATFSITLSAGVAFHADGPKRGGINPTTLVRAADEALYAAKRLGKNLVCVAGPGGPTPYRSHDRA